MQAVAQLSPEQVQSYHRNGFLAIESLIPLDEVELLREAYDRIFNERAGRGEGMQFDLAGTDEEGKTEALPQILHPSKFAPELGRMQLQAAALSVAQQLLGPEAKLLGEHAILKPAGYGAETPWHQDEAYWDPALEYEALSIWVPLQEATLENGCMQFIPGSHKIGILTHQPIGNDTRVHGLELVDPLDTSKAVACPIPAGGATVHASTTLHYAGPNRSAEPRRAYIMIFMVPPKKLDTPRDFHWLKRRHTARDEREAAAKSRETASAQTDTTTTQK